jgi:hypothetical protein
MAFFFGSTGRSMHVSFDQALKQAQYNRMQVTQTMRKIVMK